jgi:hypothetical protein
MFNQTDREVSFFRFEFTQKRKSEIVQPRVFLVTIPIGNQAVGYDFGVIRKAKRFLKCSYMKWNLYIGEIMKRNSA